MDAVLLVLAMLFLLMTLVGLFVGVAASQVAAELPDGVLGWVSRSKGPLIAGLAVAFPAGWFALLVVSGGSGLAGLAVGAAASGGYWRLSTKVHRRWLVRQARLSAPRPVLPPRGPRLAPWPAPAAFGRKFVAVRPPTLAERDSQEIADRRARRVRRDLLALAIGSFAASKVLTVAGWTAGAVVAFSVTALALAGVVVLAGYRSSRARGWRRRAHHTRGAARSLGQVAAAHGWRVFEPGHPGVASRWPSSPLLPPSSPRLVIPVTVTGKVGGWEFLAVEERSPSRHASGQPFVQHAYLLWLPGLNLPSVSLTWRGDAPVARSTGLGLPLKLELEDFNRKFLIETTEHRFAHMLFHPRVMEHLLQTLPDGCRFTAAADALILSDLGSLDPARFEDHIASLIGIANLLPSHMVQDYSYRVSAPAR
jgi:hypothetical protein